MTLYILFFIGLLIGIVGATIGLGGGFVVVPLLLLLGFSADESVGTSFLVVVLISLSALIAHASLENVNYKIGLALAIGGIIGAQIGAHFIEYIPTDVFKKIFAVILILVALKLVY